MQLLQPLSPQAPAALRYVARLGHAPHYAGSFHDNDFARRMGYPAALVPGAFLYGAMTHLALASWGLAWVEQGSIAARFLRPCFDGDPLTVSATPLQEDALGLSAEVSITREDGTEVAAGELGLPRRPPEPPDPADHPIWPMPAQPAAMAAGAMPVGAVLGSHDDVLTPEQQAQALEDFGETHPFYREQGVIPGGRLLRAIMRDANNTWRFPTAVILTACRAQHFGLARAGQRIATAGQVTGARERKGNHYFETSQLLTADRRPVALFHCTQIYAARRNVA